MKVSVIIANRNDTFMLAVTLRSVLEELSMLDGQVVICDNSDDEYWDAVQSVVPKKYIKENRIKLIRQEFPSLFTARETAAKMADGEYILCTDSHMVFGHDSIKELVSFMDRADDKIGFAHAPLSWMCQHESLSRHDMQSLYGGWGNLYDYERKISWKGMPWICRREWFLNDFNGYGVLSANRQSWGGGDLYLGIKAWLLGFENWAVPCRPIIHAGPFPTAVRKFYKYMPYSNSGLNPIYSGFLMAYYALGADSMIDDQEVCHWLTKHFKLDIKGNKNLAWRLAQEDRKWIKEHQVTAFDDLVKNPPWGEGYREANKRYCEALEIKQSNRAIRPRDWTALEGIVSNYNIKTVIEFGLGLSTLCLENMGCRVISLETNKEYTEKIRPLYKDTTIKFWNGKNINLNGQVDMAFVDGPNNRLNQVAAVLDHTKIIMIDNCKSKVQRPALRAADYLLNHGWKEIEINGYLSRAFKKGDI